MASSIFDRAIEKGIAKGFEQGIEQGIEQGTARGLAKGRLEESRRVCTAFVKRHHAGVAARVLPAIEACSDIARLHRWTLQVPELSSDELLRLIQPPAIPGASRHRTPRPARRSRRASAR